MPANSGGARPHPNSVSIYSSISSSLKLDAQKRPMDSIVVDRAEKTPTGN